MLRLDKFLCEMNIGTRSQVKTFIRQGIVAVNGTVVRAADYKVDEEGDEVSFRGESLTFKSFHYYMLNKPRGVVSATEDNTAQTVVELLPAPLRRGIFPVGRLDKDTEGLLLLTDDGALAHELLSPKKHVDKVYLVDMEAPLSDGDIERLEHGVDIGEERPTLPAKVERVSDHQILMTIREGKFHQVKRMLHAVGNGVHSLKRVAFGSLRLDEELDVGAYRELTEDEVNRLKRIKQQIQMMKQKEAVIFDLDGTLVDSMWMWRDIDIAYLGRFGISLPEDLQNCIEGMSFHETAVYFKERFKLADSLEQIKSDWNRMAWDKYMKEVPLKPGVLGFLQKCKERGIRLGIATSNSRDLIDNIVRVHGLDDYFSCIMTGCEVGKGKPAPDIYLAVAKRLGVSPDKCLVFEDIIPGIQAGLSAGMEVCAVEDDYSANDRKEKQRLAHYYIEDYYHIFEEDE
ncbi:MAG: pseudouridine synthase [Lachnospiraceae bacterium]|nr:pseudouridine synthase [Lachnospiraceae bacterium]